MKHLSKEVSFPLAKLLKEKGQNIISSKLMYASNGELTDAIYDFDDWCFAPTIAEVIDWLFEKHGIWINVTISQEDGWEYIIGNTITFDGLGYKSLFNSPKEAYEAAIEHTLNELI